MTTSEFHYDTKPIGWVRAARKAYEAFPKVVQDRVNTALTIAAEGGKAGFVKPLKGFEPGVMEIALRSVGAIEEGIVSMNEDDFELVQGSGNVFRDLGDPLADLKQAKVILAARIIAVLDDRRLTVRKAEAMTGFAAADFSRVRKADLGRFTMDRLMKMLAALDHNIRVTVQVDSRPVTDAAALATRSEP